MDRSVRAAACQVDQPLRQQPLPRRGRHAAANLIDGKKHIIAASYDGGTPASLANIKIYVDGVSIPTSYEQTNTLGSLSIVAAGQIMMIGTRDAGRAKHVRPDQLSSDRQHRSDLDIANFYPGLGDAVADSRGEHRDAVAVHRRLRHNGARHFVERLRRHAVRSGLWVP